MPTAHMLELYFGGKWGALHQGRVLPLGPHTAIPHGMAVTATYGMLRLTLRLNDGGLFIASLTFDDLDGALVQSAGATFTEAISATLRAYSNTVKSLPQPTTNLPDERGAYYRQHLTLKRRQAK